MGEEDCKLSAVVMLLWRCKIHTFVLSGHDGQRCEARAPSNESQLFTNKSAAFNCLKSRSHQETDGLFRSIKRENTEPAQAEMLSQARSRDGGAQL